eukprot:2997082-Amphidinium_carterae.1
MFCRVSKEAAEGPGGPAFWLAMWPADSCEGQAIAQLGLASSVGSHLINQLIGQPTGPSRRPAITLGKPFFTMSAFTDTVCNY